VIARYTAKVGRAAGPSLPRPTGVAVRGPCGDLAALVIALHTASGTSEGRWRRSAGGAPAFAVRLAITMSLGRR